MSGYIGPAPVPQATQTRQTFTATSGQTSFATIGYVAGGQFIQVYLNGVLLKLTDDYTAVNGSDIVLTSGATTGDILEFITFADFTVNNQNFTGTTTAADLSVTGAFTSQGIDDNATSTAMTLDGSGNLLVGKTTTASDPDTGMVLQADGVFKSTSDGSRAGDFNRGTSDGEIVRFSKDGTSVGSIGATGGYLTVTASGGSDAGAKLGNSAIFPCNTNGSDRDAGINLGLSTVRWKDLYLSGGVFLGGTGSANKLDDVEQGDWTPAYSGILAATYQTLSTQGRYVKIGRMVWATAVITTSSLTQSGSTVLLTLPFTVAGNQANYSPPSFFFENGFNPAGGAGNIQGLTAISNNYISIYTISSSTGNNYTAVSYNDLAPSATTRVRYSVCYETTA